MSSGSSSSDRGHGKGSSHDRRQEKRESNTIHTSQGDLRYGTKRDGSGHWWSGTLGGEKYSGQNATRPQPNGKLETYAHQPSHDPKESPARGFYVDPHTGKAGKGDRIGE